MIFKIKQNEFNHGIQVVQRAVSSKSTLPILQGIYMEADKEKGLKLIGNNLEIGIEYWVEADIIKEGSIVLPTTELAGIIRELPAAEIYFEANLEKYQVDIDCLHSDFTLKGYQADEFPQLPEVDDATEFVLPAEKIYNALEEIKFATSSDQSQPALTGGLLISEGSNLSLVTTNTYRLAYSIMKDAWNLDGDIGVILPGKTLNELYTLIDSDCEQIHILLNNNYVRFSFKDIVFISRLIEGEFPNYKQVIPSDFKSIIRVDRRELLDAVKRVSLIARLDSNVISIRVNEDSMDVYSSSSEYGDARESLEIELEGEKQEIDIDAGYLLDVLKVLKDEVVVIKMIGAIKPMTVTKFEEDNYIYLIMPVRPGA